MNLGFAIYHIAKLIPGVKTNELFWSSNLMLESDKMLGGKTNRQVNGLGIMV